MVMLDVVYSSVIEQKIEKKKKKLSNLDKKLINEIKKKFYMEKWILNSSDFLDLNKFDLKIESLNSIFDGKKCCIEV